MSDANGTSIHRFLESLTLDKLRQLLERECLPKTGLKADVIQRIVLNMNPPKILLHLHDDEVVRFAQQCNYKEDVSDAPMEMSHAKKVRRSSSEKHLETKRPPMTKGYDIKNADDLVRYRALANRCRIWILENVWKDHGVPCSSSSRIEYMEDTESFLGSSSRAILDSSVDFRVEELPSNALEQGFQATSLTRPLVTPPSDDEEDEDGVVIQQSIHQSTQLQSEFYIIRHIILTTLFSRLKSIRQFLLDHTPPINIGIHQFATQLSICACERNDSSSPLSLPQQATDQIVHSQPEMHPGLVNALAELSCLFWETIESSILIRRLQQESNDTGPQAVCLRLVEMCYALDFEPNFDKATIRQDDRGVIRVECQGLYYHLGAPIGPFRLYLALIRNLSNKDSTQQLTEPLLNPSSPTDLEGSDYWCIRALIWECL